MSRTITVELTTQEAQCLLYASSNVHPDAIMDGLSNDGDRLATLKGYAKLRAALREKELQIQKGE